LLADGRPVKSFTASTHLGPVKVQLPDGQVPAVRQNGRVLAEGVPEVYPSADDAPEGALVCVPQTLWHARNVIRLNGVGREDLEAAQGRSLFLIPELGPVWGGRPDETRHRLAGVQFVEGEVVPVTWDLRLTPVRRACCGRSGNEQASTLPVPVLVFELS
jgi:hypothetical protein